MGLWLDLQIAAMAASFLWFIRRTPGDLRRLRPALLAGYLGAAIGAVGLGLLLRLPAWARSGFDLDVLLHGEFMAYGALCGLGLAYSFVARRRGFDPALALDRLAAPTGLLVAVARIGCFLAGCDHGSVTRVPWAVHYPPGSAAFRHHLDAGWITPSATSSLPVHPAQLYESLVGVAMIVSVLVVERRSASRKPPPGAAFVASALTYAIGRMLVEFFRGDDRGMLGPLSTPQWLSVTLVVYLALRALSAEPRPARITPS